MLYVRKPETIRHACFLALKRLVEFNGICPECQHDCFKPHASECLTGIALAIMNHHKTRIEPGFKVKGIKV